MKLPSMIVLMGLLIPGARAGGENVPPVAASSEKIIYTPKPREAVAPLSPKGASRRRPEAWTKGSFRISYLLAQEADAVKAKNVRIKIKNTIVLPKNASPALIQHEAVHQQINETAAARIQKEMAEFTRPCKDWRDLERAEKEFKEEFYDKVRAVNELHKDWDATNKLK